MSPIVDKERLRQVPPPQGQVTGWYPDPMGSTAERFWDSEWMELTRSPRLRLAAEALVREQAKQTSRLSLRDRVPPILLPPVSKEKREQRAREREHMKQQLWTEAERQAFFRTPAGRARLAFERGQHLFQYELDIDRIGPTVIPAPIGTAARETEDAVDILNSVVVEGWKLVDGKFFYVAGRGLVGCYLFRRSKKRRQKLNDPWRG
ncbi:MAG TPA: DUF2510 domain-containing protein [Solirubrobacterales bacterium]|nr:DUF2510 domain-containing protein [Solirubrobacterales bacterium]